LGEGADAPENCDFQSFLGLVRLQEISKFALASFKIPHWGLGRAATWLVCVWAHTEAQKTTNLQNYQAGEGRDLSLKLSEKSQIFRIIRPGRAVT